MERNCSRRMCDNDAPSKPVEIIPGHTLYHHPYCSALLVSGYSIVIYMPRDGHRRTISRRMRSLSNIDGPPCR
jgi:hypothetical protein